MKEIHQEFMSLAKLILVLGLILTGFNFIFAGTWNAPTASAPGNNTAEPINVSALGQIKEGNLFIKGLNSSGAVLQNAFVVLNGNVGFGTESPAEKLHIVGGKAQADDFCLNSDPATCLKKLAADIVNGGGAGGTSSYTYETVVKSSAYTVDCPQNTTMVSGGCWCVDATNNNDSSAYGGRPTKNGWECMPTTGGGCSGGITSYARCASPASSVDGGTVIDGGSGGSLPTDCKEGQVVKFSGGKYVCATPSITAGIPGNIIAIGSEQAPIIPSKGVPGSYGRGVCTIEYGVGAVCGKINNEMYPNHIICPSNTVKVLISSVAGSPINGGDSERFFCMSN